MHIFIISVVARCHQQREFNSDHQNAELPDICTFSLSLTISRHLHMVWT